MEFGDILRTRALHNGSNLRFGLTVGELRNGEYGVEALLTDGSSQTYDLVVGADGLRSTVRSMIFPAAPPPTYIGQHIWRVLVGNRPPEIDSQMLFVGERSRVGLNPILPDDMYIYLLNQAEESREKLTDKDAHAQLMELFGDYGGIAREIASGLSLDCPAHHASLYTIFMEGPWHQGRVVLIGDAAHATPPHLAGGAAIAIEDAIVLARLLGTGDSVTEVFESFMNQRYERCRMVINNSRQLSRWDLDPNVDGRKAAALTTQTWEKLAVPI